jgi:hypothetical protein
MTAILNKCNNYKTATAPYFYGFILLRAVKSKIIIVLTYVFRTKFLYNSYVKVLFSRCTILSIIDWYNEDFRKSTILMPKVNL